MTRRHARYLVDYPERTALKRRKRRIKARANQLEKKTSTRNMRRALERWIQERPAIEPIRAGKPTIAQKIKNYFRKPTV